MGHIFVLLYRQLPSYLFISSLADHLRSLCNEYPRRVSVWLWALCFLYRHYKTAVHTFPEYTDNTEVQRCGRHRHTTRDTVRLREEGKPTLWTKLSESVVIRPDEHVKKLVTRIWLQFILQTGPKHVMQLTYSTADLLALCKAREVLIFQRTRAQIFPVTFPCYRNQGVLPSSQRHPITAVPTTMLFVFFSGYIPALGL